MPEYNVVLTSEEILIIATCLQIAPAAPASIEAIIDNIAMKISMAMDLAEL